MNQDKIKERDKTIYGSTEKEQILITADKVIELLKESDRPENKHICSPSIRGVGGGNGGCGYCAYMKSKPKTGNKKITYQHKEE